MYGVPKLVFFFFFFFFFFVYIGLLIPFVAKNGDFDIGFVWFLPRHSLSIFSLSPLSLSCFSLLQVMTFLQGWLTSDARCGDPKVRLGRGSCENENYSVRRSFQVLPKTTENASAIFLSDSLHYLPLKKNFRPQKS